jgi:hypothetical protein
LFIPFEKQEQSQQKERKNNFQNLIQKSISSRWCFFYEIKLATFAK